MWDVCLLQHQDIETFSPVALKNTTQWFFTYVYRVCVYEPVCVLQIRWVNVPSSYWPGVLVWRTPAVGCELSGAGGVKWTKSWEAETRCFGVLMLWELCPVCVFVPFRCCRLFSLNLNTHLLRPAVCITYFVRYCIRWFVVLHIDKRQGVITFINVLHLPVSHTRLVLSLDLFSQDGKWKLVLLTLSLLCRSGLCDISVSVISYPDNTQHYLCILLRSLCEVATCKGIFLITLLFVLASCT